MAAELYCTRPHRNTSPHWSRYYRHLEIFRDQWQAATMPYSIENCCGRYVLDDDGNPVPEPDVAKWADWLAGGKHILRYDHLPDDVSVSTIFLALDMDFGLPKRRPPLFWQTAILGGVHDGSRSRYSTRQEAVSGHLMALHIATTAGSA